MSVTFFLSKDGRYVGPKVRKVDPCLCAQMHPHYAEMCERVWEGKGLTMDHEAGLLQYANPGCTFCSGTGVETSYSEERSVNMCNRTYEVISHTFGLGKDPWGSMQPSKMSNLIEGFRASKVFRAPAQEPLTNTPFRARVIECEVTAQRLADMVDRIQGLVDEAGDGEMLSWS